MLKKTILFGAIALLLSACASHNGIISNTGLIQSGSNYEYVDVAIGYSKAQYIFGIGGLNKDVLVNDAKRNMYLSVPLASNQAFDNITLDFSVTNILIYKKIEAIMIADVVQVDSTMKVNYKPSYYSLISSNKPKQKGEIALNQNVVIKFGSNAVNARVVNLTKNKATLFFVDENGNTRVKNMGYQNVFKAENVEHLETKFGAKIGDMIKIVNHKDKYSVFLGKVVGLNANSALLASHSKCKIISIEEIKESQKNKL